jgi:hypothetical protein
MIDKVAETIGYKQIFEMAKNVGYGEIGLLGMLKGSRSIAASAGSLKKIDSLFKKADKDIKKGDREGAIILAREARAEVKKVMEKPGNASLYVLFGKMLTELDNKITWLESGKDLSLYNASSQKIDGTPNPSGQREG